MIDTKKKKKKNQLVAITQQLVQESLTNVPLLTLAAT